jgi:hypothetical protein
MARITEPNVGGCHVLDPRPADAGTATVDPGSGRFRHAPRSTVIAAVTVLVAAAACTPPAPTSEPTPAPASLRGLLILDRGGRASELQAWLGSGSSPAQSTIEIDLDSEQISASTKGRIAALVMEDRLHVSAPVSSSNATAAADWRRVTLISDGSALFEEGQFDFPAWDPTGARLALAVGNGAEGYGLLVVDPDAGTTRTIGVPGVGGVLGPVWLDDTTIAATIPHVSYSEPADGASPAISFTFSTALVDIASGKVSPGPARSALAGTPNGRFVLTTGAWGELAPLTIQATDVWLRGSDEALAILEAPADAVSGMIVTFDQTGTRAAVAWWSGAEAIEDARMTVRVYDAASDWKPVAELPVTDSWPVQLAWLP